MTLSNIKIPKLWLVFFAGISLGIAGHHITSRALAAPPQASETVVKTQGSSILFIVNGREQARIDAQGLLINGDIRYTGFALDTGASKHD